MSSQLQVSGEAKIRDIQGPVVANSGVITALDGAASQYVRGDGTLADFPTSSGGGSSVSYYLNSSVSQGTIGGVAYRELSKDPIIGAGTDIPIAANGYVANYITDANDPDVVLVPGGNFNCEFYFSVNNNTGNPTTYAELYKYDGTTFTLLGTSAGVPESINQGTTIAPYYFAIPVATAALSVTDRLAIRIYVNVDSRTVTLHTENGHLCQVVTTLSKGMVSLNNLTDQSQYLATGTSGTNFAIVSSGDTHTFNLPVASATNTGKLSSTDWSTFNNKQNALTNPITGTGANGQVTFFNGTTSVIGSNNFFWDNTNSFLGVGTNVPSAGITSFSSTPAFQFKAAGTAPGITFSNTLTSASLACVFGLATANNQFITGTAAGDMAIANQSTSAGAIVFGTGTTERMRMTSAGTLSIGNTNSTYKLDVTGIVRFTGELTGSSAVFSSTVRPASSFTSDLGTSSFRWNDIYGFSLTLTSSVTALSLIKSGGTSSQFLMADGSVNTSVLPSGAYLPLTGGTLTGALSGTSATFSGNLNVGTNIAQLLPITTTNFQILTGCFYDGSNIIATATSGTRIISNAGSFTFNNFTGATIGSSVSDTARLTIASTGAATFSSSVTATTQLKVSNTTGTALDMLVLETGFSNPSGNKSIIWKDATNALGRISVSYDASTGSTMRFGSLYNGGYQTSDLLTIASTGAATFSSNVTAVGLITGQNGIYQTNAAGSIASNRFETYNGGATQMQFLYPASGSVGWNNGSDRMVLTSGGSVGIGTSSPSSLLQLAGGGTGTRGALRFSDAGLSNYWEIGRDNGSTGNFTFSSQASQLMTITTGGNVGIGTSSPATTLDVRGSSSSTIRVGSSTHGGSGDEFGNLEFYWGDPDAAEVKAKIYAKNVGNVGPGGGGAADLLFATTPAFGSSTERMRITSGGQVQIKQPADGFTEGLRWINTLGNRWTFVTGGDNNFYIGFNEASRGIFNSSTGVYTAQSDKNKKKDFEQSTIGLNAVLGLKPTLYRMKDDDELVEKHLGFIAQEVKEFIPQAYSESTNDDNTFIGLTEMPIIAALVKAIQELKAEKDAEILELKNQIEELKAMIAAK